MTEEQTKMLVTVFCEVLENQAYMFGEALRETPQCPEDVIVASMAFRGPFQGSLSLAVPRAICPEIAANVLGLELDDDEVESHAEDAFKELLNVICGRVLTTMAGEEPVFDLTVPVVEPIDETEWDAMAARSGAVAFDVDDMPVLLCLNLE